MLLGSLSLGFISLLLKYCAKRNQATKPIWHHETGWILISYKRLDCNLIENQIHWDLLIRIQRMSRATTGTTTFFADCIWLLFFFYFNERVSTAGFTLLVMFCIWIEVSWQWIWRKKFSHVVLSRLWLLLFILVLNMEFQFG